MQTVRIRKIAFAAIVAALYATLTMVLSFIGYGPIQFRLAEVFCVLPFFFPVTSIGLFVGCIIANLLSPYGIIDILAGSAATLIAALFTMSLGRLKTDALFIKALACFPPVLFNALIVGAVIAWTTTGGGEAFRTAFAVYGLQVGIGQFAVMYIFGLPAMVYLPKTHLFALISRQYI